MDLMNWMADMLWPRRCIKCKAVGADVCAGCRGSFVRTPMVRIHPAAGGASGLTIASAGTMTDEPLARAIWHLKYRNLTGLADPLAAWLADTVCNHPALPSLSDHVIVPVPLHPYKYSERGYNQAELLAQALGRILAIPVVTDALVRVRHTASQVESGSRGERVKNMSGAFALEHPELVEGHPILLIDDVSTTGATLSAAALPLIEAHAASITGVVVARG